MIEQNQSSTIRLIPMAAIEAEFGVLSEIPSLPSGAFNMEAINYHRATNTLWTLVDGVALPTFTSGYHFVNRLGYYRSEKPVPVGMTVDEQPDESMGICSDCDGLWDIDFDNACPNCGGGRFVGPND
jgi:hypothetical protein